MTDDARSLSWRGKLLLAVISPIVAFGLAEAVLRVVGYRYEPWKAPIEGQSHVELEQTAIYEPDPDLIWTLRPYSVLDFPGYGFLRIPTNSEGLRGKELPGPRQPGELRILCLGDSITFGLGLAEGETWPARMEEALRAAPEMAERTVRVINGAVPGYSSFQGMRMLSRLHRLEPDVIVFWFGMNDARPMRILPDRALSDPTVARPRLMAAIGELRVVELVQQLVTSLRKASVEGTRVSREEYREHVEELLELERAGGPRVVFVRVPERCALAIEQLEIVVRQAEAAGAEVVVAPRRLLSWIVPAPDSVDLEGRPVTWRGRPAIRFEPDARFQGYERSDTAVDLSEVREGLEKVRELKRSLDAILEGLPEDALRYEGLFGDAPTEDVFIDNCHLSPQGARLAGKAIAEAVRRALEAPR